MKMKKYTLLLLTALLSTALFAQDKSDLTAALQAAFQDEGLIGALQEDGAEKIYLLLPAAGWEDDNSFERLARELQEEDVAGLPVAVELVRNEKEAAAALAAADAPVLKLGGSFRPERMGLNIKGSLTGRRHFLSATFMLLAEGDGWAVEQAGVQIRQ